MTMIVTLLNERFVDVNVLTLRRFTLGKLEKKNKKKINPKLEKDNSQQNCPSLGNFIL